MTTAAAEFMQRTFDLEDPRCFAGLEHCKFLIQLKEESEWYDEHHCSTEEVEYRETIPLSSSTFLFSFRCEDGDNLYLRAKDIATIQMYLPPLQRDDLYTMGEIEEAIKALRRRRSYASIGEDHAGEIYTADDHFSLCKIAYRYPNIAEEGENITRRLKKLIAEVENIVQHECKWRSHDSDQYVLPCGVCGSDGNA